MTAQRTPYLIIGGGLAAASAAEILAKKQPGRVCLVSAENHLPYARPPLSKAVLAGETAPSKVYLKPREFYRDKGIEVVLGHAAIGLNTEQRVVRLSSGRHMGYETLLLATGLVPARLDIPGFLLPGVHMLRNLEDAIALRDEIAPGRTVVVIGGGFIGCEVAATAIARGAHVHVVETDAVLMERAVGRDVGEILTEHHRRVGVHTYLRATAVEIRGHKRAEAVCLDSGALLHCDVVVVGVGSRAATSWLTDTSIALSEGGIVVDGHCRTADPHVYAAGDAAAAYSPLLDQHVRIEHESNAQQQGALAARNMLGGTTVGKSLPFVWSKQFDLDMWCVGDTRTYDRVEIGGDVSGYRFVAVYLAQSQPVAVLGVNSAGLAAARKLMRATDDRFTVADLLAAESEAP